jgi:hypothetical protein
MSTALPKALTNHHNTRFSIGSRPIIAALFLCFAFCRPAASQPALTTVHDVIYLADGAKFNGLAFFDWKSFDAPNGAVIGQYSKVVRIVDGILRVQLAPTTNTANAYYSVRYSSGGRILFTEIWAVPPSTATLKLRDVRAILLPGGFVSANTPPPSNGGGNSGGGNPIVGDSSGNFVDGETPAGLLNGANSIFTLTATPSPTQSLTLYRNGVLVSPVTDYNITGNTITFVPGATPETGDILRAYYRSGPIGGGGLTAHNLLSEGHPDTVAESVQRGDLITGQSSSTRWTRLPLGAANRCLISNGLDAVWNSCLFTGFTSGAVPFVNSAGLLSQDASSFYWDASNRRLGLGTASPSANLTIQGSSSQGSTNLTRWLNSSGAELARVEADGAFVIQRLTTSTNSTRSAWRDTGSNLDPSSRLNGDFWFNNSQQARKSFEAGQIHPMPQVICSSTGGSTTSTASTQLGSCTIPTSFLDAGDRIEVFMNFDHTGTASNFNVEFRFGSQTVLSRNYNTGESSVFAKASGGLHPTGTSWGVTVQTGNGFGDTTVANTTGVPTASFVISFRGNLGSASSDTVILRNYTVVRYPAQFNP